MWYYAKNDEQMGPVEDRAMEHLVREGIVTAQTLVWKPGMKNWAPAGSVGLAAASAPPPPATPTPPPIPAAGPSAAPPPAPASVPSETRTLAVLTHVAGLLTNFVGPLIVLAATQDSEVKAHARRALNWQLSLLLYGFVSGALVLVLIGIPLLLALAACDFVFCVIAAVKAADGARWNYPMAIPFLKD